MNDYILTASIIFKIIVISALIDQNDDEMMKLSKSMLSHNDRSFVTSDINLSNQTLKFDIYKLWHKRLIYFEFAKFRNFHQITILKKIISIVKNQNSCKICALIKIINKRNHQYVKQKIQSLNLISINICEEFLSSKKNINIF